MVSKDQNLLSGIIGEQDQKSLIDFKRVGYRAIRYWYFVLFSLVLALSIAFYQNRYTLPIYPVSTSIIIREVEETTGAELLYKNAIVDQYRNYLNEPYILKSYPLIRKVIEDLDFTISFYREGYFLTIEAYDYIPVRAKLKKIIAPNGGKYIFKLLDEKRYSIELFEEGKALRQERRCGCARLTRHAREVTTRGAASPAQSQAFASA